MSRSAHGGELRWQETRGNGAYLQTLGKGLCVLEELRQGPLTIQELMRRLDTNRSATYRLVATLAKHGFVSRMTHDDTYSLGPRLWGLGAAALGPADAVRRAATRYLRDLAARSGETAHIATYEPPDVIYIARAEGANPIRVSAPPAGVAPAFCTAAGKLLVARSSRQEWSQVFRTLEPYTKETITDPERLSEELIEIRERNYAVNRGEWRPQVGGVAVPLPYEESYPDLALGVSGPLERILEQLPDLLDKLTETSATIEAALGRANVAETSAE